jgi:predicted kinase
VDEQATLYFMCGKMGAGKSTLAKSLAETKRAVFLSEDDLLRELYPNEISDLNDYVARAARVKQALSGHICSLLRRNVSVVLDFPANTVAQRTWFRELIDTSGALHELHFVDTPDDICKEQLAERSRLGSGDPLQDAATFDLLAAYFTPPGPKESFDVVRHLPGTLSS